MFFLPSHCAALLTVSGIAIGGAAVQAAPSAAIHVRGSIASLQGRILTVTTAAGPVRVQLAAKTPVVGVIPSDRAHIKDGSFLGIASRPQADGSQKAMEVVVFPEAARGAGEGSYAWDLPGSGAHSKMTNGTAHTSRMTNGTAHKAAGSAVTLQYKSGTGMGSQNITLPANIPIVTFAPGQPPQLTPGAHVFVIGRRLPSGSVAADRVMVGKNGLVPPM